MAASGPNTASGKPAGGKAPYYAFFTDATDIAAAKAFATKKGLPDSHVLQGDAGTAAEFLKTNASPGVLFVEVPSAKAAPELLNKLADTCDPNTKVVVTGPVNEYSFYCWLMDLGISSYLLRPLTPETLETAWTKATEPPVAAAGKVKDPGRFIGFLGARGGVGVTSLSILFTALLARKNTEKPIKKIALLDLDPQDGSLSLLLELDPSRGLREALERPDRIDTLFMDRAVQKTNHGFSAMSAEEALHEPIAYHAQAAEILITELRKQFDLLVLDLPRRITPFTRAFLAVCDPVFVVTDMSLTGLRDSMRLSDMFRDQLRLKPPVFVANQVGRAPKHEMSGADFKKGLNTDARFHIPFAPDFFMPMGADLGMLKNAKAPAFKVLEQMAASMTTVEAGAKKGGLFKKGK